MKKVLTLTLAIMCCTLYALAADFDLIIKNNSEKIEAIIQEVSDTELRYKKANNPNGPVFIIKLTEVASIVYSNGEVQAIEHKAQNPQQSWNSGYNFSNNGYNYALQQQEGPMRRIGKNEYMIDGHTLKGKEFRFFLDQNCPPAARYYKKWRNAEIAGYCLLSVGAVLAVVGGVIGATEGGPIGLAAGVPGVALLASGVSLAVCGNIYKKRVPIVFNTNCGNPQAYNSELKVIAGSNGLGLAMTF